MKRKRTIIYVIIVVVAALIFLGLGRLKRSKTPPDFQFAELKRGDLEILVSSTGTLNAVETVAVGAEVSGTIKEVYVDHNDTVKKGELLALVDPTVFKASVREAEAVVMKAEAMVRKSKAEYEKKEKLFEKGHISEFDLLTLKTTLNSTEADLLSAEAKLIQAENNLKNTMIRSPISGTVIERSVNAGQTIASSFQAPELFIIAENLKKMHIEAYVDENDIGQVEEDQRVRFTVQAYPDLIFEGTVRQVRLKPETIQNVVNYTVVIDVSNEEGLLLPGMTATIDFIILDHSDSLLVPNSALSYQPLLPEDTPKEGGLLANFVKSEQGETKPAMPPTRKISAGKERVFYLNGEGHLSVAIFTPGESDGIFTEVLGTITLKEGMKVITGVSSQGKEKVKANKNMLFRMPGRPPR